MKNLFLLEELKVEIEKRRTRLNNLVVSDVGLDEILEYSKELDRLIGKYYQYQLLTSNI